MSQVKTTSLHIAHDLSLPLDAVTNTFGIIGVRGAGKTFTAKKVAEQMLKQGNHIICIDPVGVWHGLRSSADGKRPGLSILVLGGEHGDIAIDHTQGAKVAELVVEQRCSVVLDLSDMRKGQAVTFLTAFCETLYRLKARQREALHIFMDEADVYAPQTTVKYGADGGNPERLLGSVEDLVRRGRSRGIGITLISQRPAKLNKNVLTQIETLFALRITSPQDRAAIKAWAEGNGTKEQQDTMLGSLASLKTGQAWVWSPNFLDVFKQVRIDRIETFDSSSTPEVGQQVKVAVASASIDLEKIRAALTPEPKVVPSKRLPVPQTIRERVEVPVSVLTDEDRALLVTVQTMLDGVIGHINEIKPKLSAIFATADAVLTKERTTPQPTKFVPVKPTPTPIRGNGTDGITGPQMRILNALVTAHRVLRLARVSRDLLATFSNYVPNAPTYRANLTILRDAGLIDIAEAEGKVSCWATAHGETVATVDPTVPTGLKEYQEAWLSRLIPGQRRIMEFIMSYYPESLERAWMAPHVGYVHNAPTYRENLNKLSRLGMISYNGSTITPTDLLFPKELQ